MKKIKKVSTNSAQSISAFVSQCYCTTCQDCRTGSSQAISYQNNAQSEHDGHWFLQMNG